MNFLVIVLSSNKALRQFAAKNRAALVPSGSLKQGYLSEFKLNIQVNAIDPLLVQSSSIFEKYVLSRADSAKFLVVLADPDAVHLTDHIRSSALVSKIDTLRASNNYLNYFHSLISKIIRSLNHLALLFDNSLDYSLLSLPLRNFMAPELGTLKDAAESRVTEAEFVGQIDAAMQSLRRRIRPRKKSRYPTKYAVDDKGRFFVFGKEHHSLPATGIDHFPFCQINSIYRFGVLIDNTRHFNVSEGEADKTTISGTFTDCHGTNHIISGGTHLNMFSNDYF